MSEWRSHTITFSYDSAGNLAEIDAGNGTVTAYTYDSDENLETIATTKSGVTQLSFDASGTNGIGPDGALQNVTTTQGSSQSFGLTPGDSTTAGTDKYQYDVQGRLLTDKQTGTGSATSTYGYNDNGETGTLVDGTGTNTIAHAITGQDPGPITQVTNTGGSFPWKYTNSDSDGNRTSQAQTSPCTRDPAAVTQKYDAADRLYAVGWGYANPPCSGEPVLAHQAYDCLTYDGNGEAETVDWTQVEPSSAYNNQTLTWSTASGLPWLAVYTDDDNGATHHTDFIPGPQGTPVEQINIGTDITAAWYYYDLSGNTRVLLDFAVSQAYNYDPYGNVSNARSTRGFWAVDSNLEYGGAPFDG